MTVDSLATAFRSGLVRGEVYLSNRFTMQAGFVMGTTVTLSNKYQIVIPQEARKALSLSAGDELLVLSKPDRVVIIPKQESLPKR
jgi:AbrB family looped-hinge helix DNA binding protein